MYCHHIPKAREAITRIEAGIIVVMLVVGIGCLLPLMQKTYGPSNRSASKNNLRQIVIATISNSDQNNGIMPTGRTPDIPDDQLKDFFILGPCLYQILPQMDNDPLFNQGRVTIGDVHGHSSWLVTGKPFKPYQAPQDPTLETKKDRTSYLANELALPVTTMRFPESYSDGTAYTIFYAEAHSLATETVERDGSLVNVKVKRHWWDKPVWCPVPGSVQFELDMKPGTSNALLPQGFNKSGMQVALGDGSVRNMPLRMNHTATFYNACTPSSGDKIGDDW